MKLYHNGEPEGWQIPGKQDRKAERIDVPSSPADLAAWLNVRDVSPRATPHGIMAPELEDFTAQDREDHTGDAAAYLRGPIAGAVITEAEVDRVNASRPTFLPRLDAAEIERRRMALDRCPKCNSAAAVEIGVDQVLAWIHTAEAEQLERVAAAVKDEAAELGEQGRAN